MLGLPTLPAPSPTVQGTIQGRVQEAAQGQGSRQPPRRRTEQRRSRGPNYAGVQKPRRQETSSSARNVGTRAGQDDSVLEDARKWREQRATRTRNAAQAQQRAASELTCGNCLEHGHRVRDCIHPAVDGFVHGCPICNQSDHESAEGCKMSWPQRLEKKLLWAVEQRARRPTLAAFPNWMALLAEARDKGDIALPQNFPWTPSFTQDLMEGKDFPWTTLNYAANDSSNLPEDELTKGIDTIWAEEAVLCGIPMSVVDNTGGEPWMPRPLEPADVDMDEVENLGLAKVLVNRSAQPRLDDDVGEVA